VSTKSAQENKYLRYDLSYYLSNRRADPADVQIVLVEGRISSKDSVGRHSNGRRILAVEQGGWKGHRVCLHADGHQLPAVGARIAQHLVLAHFVLFVVERQVRLSEAGHQLAGEEAAAQPRPRHVHWFPLVRGADERVARHVAVLSAPPIVLGRCNRISNSVACILCKFFWPFFKPNFVQIVQWRKSQVISLKF
jgi:hypothetical protein